MSINLTKLVFDTTVPANGANVGAYLRDASGNLLTSTLVGADQALDVNIVQATGLGIFAEDSAHVSADLGQQVLAVRNDTPGSLVGTDGDYAPLQVDASGFLRVSGSDFDIRDLSHSQDSIKIGDGTDFLAINADGSINVNADISVTTGHEKAEDSAHASTDIGSYVLSVIQSTLSASAADGDYGSFKTDTLGRLWTNRSGQSAAYGAVSVANTATDIIGTDLTNRIKVIVQNVSNKDVYIGSDNSVTSSNGIKLSAESSIELEVGPGINLHGITASGSADVRYFEVA